MTSTGQVKLRRWKETSPGVPPSPLNNTVVTDVRFRSENFGVRPTLTESDEITAGGETISLNTTGRTGAGELSILFSYGSYDVDVEGLFKNSTWEGTAVQISAAGGDACTWTQSTRTITLGAGSWGTTPTAGDVISVRGFGSPYLDGVHRVVSATATTIVLFDDDRVETVVDIASTPAIKIRRGQRLKNSDGASTITQGFEKQIERTRGVYAAVTASAGAPRWDYSIFETVLPTRMQLSCTGEGTLQGTISYSIGTEETEFNQTPADSGVVVSSAAANQNPTFNGNTAFKRVYFWESGHTAKYHICPQSINIEFANGGTATPVMCPAETSELIAPTFSAKVTISGIYESPFFHEQFNKEREGVMEVAMMDSSGNAVMIRFNRARITTAARDTGGRGQLLSVTFEVTALGNASASPPDGAPTSANYGPSIRAVDFHRIAA